MVALTPGFPEDIQAAEIQSGNVLSAHISGGQVLASHLAYGQIGTGSPVSFGASILYGSSTTSAGSTAWVVFGDTFKAAPKFIVSAAGASAVGLTGSPVTAGSALVVSEGGSVPFSWIAIGSGSF